jgi:methanogenic corrinoid protein MtbC1
VEPAELGARVLGRLGLPTRAELCEVAEMGVTTFDIALALGSPELLADFLCFAAHRVAVLAPAPPLPGRVRSLPRDLLGDQMSPGDVEPLETFLVRALDLASAPGADSRPVLDDLARTYLGHALAGHREPAVAVVVDAVRAGTDLAVVLTEILEAAQQEIGRLWEEGRISVAEEHYCTAITQLAMTALYPYLFDADASGSTPRRRLVAVQAGGSLHEVGLRMVVDLLEHEGWDTTYLGAEEDPDRVVAALVDQGAGLLAISASMPGHVGAVADLVRSVRADPRTAGVRIVVGGRPFIVAPALAGEVGADGAAHDAREAVALCARLAEASDVSV